jgi:hypothetical protein
MWHIICNQVNWVDSWLFFVESQTGTLTPGPSFGHNLCFRCLNEECEPILNIHVPRAFQWCKERHKPLIFDPSNRSLKFQESIGSPWGLHLPKWELPWEWVWVFIPLHSLTLFYTFESMWCDSHFFTLSRVCDVTHTFLHFREYVMWLMGFLLAHILAMPLPWLSGFLPLSPQPCNPFALVTSPKLGLRHVSFFLNCYN